MPWVQLLRGHGTLAGTGIVDGDGTRHTADHIVLAISSGPIMPLQIDVESAEIKRENGTGGVHRQCKGWR